MRGEMSAQVSCGVERLVRHLSRLQNARWRMCLRNGVAPFRPSAAIQSGRPAERRDTALTCTGTRRTEHNRWGASTCSLRLVQQLLEQDICHGSIRSAWLDDGS